MSILVVVESKGKIDKIQKILGDKYKVIASLGHIIDLDPSDMSIDFEKNFEPKYKIIEDKKKIVQNLKTAYKSASDILIASDKDREGEMIAWSISKELGIRNPKRMVFTSITKKDLLDAISNIGTINQHMVDSQKTRRLLDRIIGYSLSPLVSKAISGATAAGRVMSIICKLIVEKENEINDFFKSETVSYFKFNSILTNKTNRLKASLYDGKEIAKIPTSDMAYDLIKILTTSTYTISDITKKTNKRNPSEPFITSSLQQEAAKKLGFVSERTMIAAQNLYENGLITYMRTDSVNLSDEAMDDIAKYIIEKYGKNYYNKKIYTNSGENAQEAHEAIRPCDINQDSILEYGRIGSDEIKLYDLIWKRTVASQMTPALIDQTIIQISISQTKYIFKNQTHIVTFKGFTIVYVYDESDDELDDKITDENLIPVLGDSLTALEITSSEEFPQPPQRYSEASLLKKLDKNNLDIGRPATTSTAIKKIQSDKVNYVVKKDINGIDKTMIIYCWKKSENITKKSKKIIIGKEKNKFTPTQLGIYVNKFLSDNFEQIMNYKFTSMMEKKLDLIERGNIKWNDCLSEFYKDFKPLIQSHQQICLKKSSDRLVGIDSKSGANIYASKGKYGDMLKIINPNSEKPIFVKIKPPLTVSTITLEDALKLTQYPKILGSYENNDVILSDGKFGYWLKCGSLTHNLSMSFEEVEQITLDIAISKLNQNKYIWQGSDDKYKYIIKEGQNYVMKIPIKSKQKIEFANITDLSDISIEKIKLLFNKSSKKIKKN